MSYKKLWEWLRAAQKVAEFIVKMYSVYQVLMHIVIKIMT